MLFFKDTTTFDTPDSSATQEPLVLIAVVGITGSGKTTFVNKASGSGMKVGHGLGSCTQKIQVSNEFILDGRRVVLIDTPGFDDTKRSDTKVLQLIATHLVQSYVAGMKLAGIIYVHRISETKFDGLAAKNFTLLRELCGEETLKSVVLMTNMWGRVTPEQGDARERQLRGEYFKPAIDNGAQLCRHDNTLESAREILRKIVRNKPDALRLQIEMVHEGKSLKETAAGTVLRDEIQVEIRAVKEEMKAVVERMQKTTDEMKATVEWTQKTTDEKDKKIQMLEEEGREMRELIAGLKENLEDTESRLRDLEQGVDGVSDQISIADPKWVHKEPGSPGGASEGRKHKHWHIPHPHLHLHLGKGMFHRSGKPEQESCIIA